jgi:SWI/SNF chromatin-remodeling complex subunit SWI1
MDFQSPQNGMYDPSNFIDPSAIGNGQMNGTRPYPMSSIPQKRDSTGASLSRSQTPSQQPQFGFQQGFAHTPSPTMQNQHFRPGQIAPQRMQSPAQNMHSAQMSPMGVPQGQPMAQGYNPNAGGQYRGIQLSENLSRQQEDVMRRHQMQQMAQAQAQAQQHQQLGNLAASNMAATQRYQPGQMPGMPGQHPGMQRNMMQGQTSNQDLQRQAFMKNLASLMAQQGRHFNPAPQVGGRPVDLHRLYYAVMKFKGYRYVTQSNQWPRIAHIMNINMQQIPSAGDELRMVYEAQLGLYETAYLAKQQSMRAAVPMQAQVGSMGSQMSPTRPTAPGQPTSADMQQQYLHQLQRSKAGVQQQHPDPARQQQQQHQAQQQPPPQQQQYDPGLLQSQPQYEHATPVQSNATMAAVNGESTPQAETKFEQHSRSLSRQLDGTPEQPRPGTSRLDSAVEKPTESKDNTPTALLDGKITYRPSTRTIDRWSGLDFEAENLKKRVDELVHFTPNVPLLHELGVIDLRALTMSIRSGLHAEVRLALDTLSRLTWESAITLDLNQCDDLVEVLVDYAEDQLQLLANDNPEVSDILDLPPYEDVIHNCHAERHSLLELPEFGTKEFELDRTADRLLAITTILRNLSFLEINHNSLSIPEVLSFLSNAIRLVGTRVLLLRSHINTFDFMKDLVTFFSNTSTKIVLPSREDAYTILHFLCAFAPVPRPSTPLKFTPYNPKVHRYLPSAVDSLAKLLARDDPNRTYYKQIFVSEASSSSPYDLLTRAFALAIAVVPDRTSGILHDTGEKRIADVRIVEARIAEARKPYLMQGMLAADILASLAPGSDSGVCRTWLESEDGWAASLLKFAMSLCATDANIHPPQQDPRMGGRNPRSMDHDIQGFQLIVHRALSMLRRLGEKSKGGDMLIKGLHTNGHTDSEDGEEEDELENLDYGRGAWKVKADVLPKKETLLSALLTPSLDPRSLRQFCSIGYLDEVR